MAVVGSVKWCRLRKLHSSHGNFFTQCNTDGGQVTKGPSMSEYIDATGADPELKAGSVAGHVKPINET